MKTWIFGEDKLNAAIDRWINRQMETGHPVAVRNAVFVGDAIRDLLCGDSSLFKEVGQSSGYIRKADEIIDLGAVKRPPSDIGSSGGDEGFSVENMLNEWNNIK